MRARETFLENPKGPGRRRRAAVRPAPLDEAVRGRIVRQWRLGASVEALAEQYGQSRPEIERVINEARAQRILARALEYVHHPSFDAPGAVETILAPTPDDAPGARTRIRPPAGLPPYLAGLYGEATLLSREQEAHLFRKMNYLKYRAARLREAIDPAHARTADLDEIERLQDEALAVKNQIISANLRLVVSIAKKRVGPNNTLFELISDGNMSLIHAVEKFDFSRGFKFSTYASWAIIKNFARSIPEEQNRRDRFGTGFDEIFASAADHRADEGETENDQRHHRETVRELLGVLDDRERRILVSRYGLDGASERTLQQLGQELGVTKERVRQLEARAQERLRKFALERRLDPLAL